MTRYTPERGYGLDLSGPEPVWRGKRPGWSKKMAMAGWMRNPRAPVRRVDLYVARQGLYAAVPRYRIDDYIKKGLIDPARRDDL